LIGSETALVEDCAVFENENVEAAGAGVSAGDADARACHQNACARA
jgi:hypothetical protein